MKRNEIKVLIEASITPSFQDSEKHISEKFSKPIENIVIKKVEGKFGSNTFLIHSYIYDSKEAKEQTEPKKKEKGAKK